ncbi:MAG TPA: ATP-binding protein [Terriglobales bacterium]|jgi:two-component system sensor histidine kinase CpxA|nr:ATP-binding protein [Terriglobales bacterium]
MKSLFLKIFLSFWAAQVLFVVLAILATIALSPARHGIESESPQILAEAVNAYQSGGERAAHEYVEELWRTHHVWASVFDPAGHEITGRRPRLEDVRPGGPPSDSPMRGGPPRHRGWLDYLLPDRVIRQALTLDGKRYTLVLVLPPGPRVFFGPHDIPLLGIAIAIITSGLMCWLLAWSITSPVTRLRQAAQSLAAGDLTARTGAPPGGRHDELTELMRDFDRMAERIEGLVDSQSRLLKDVSHELRSPLARLSVALGLARQKTPADVAPELEASLQRIELEADRLNQLIQRLLTIARLESGTDGLRKSNLSLLELVKQVAHDAEYEKPEQACRVSTHASTDASARASTNGDFGDEFLVEADPDLLRSAIENVVRNATRYTAKGTTVEVRLERQETADGQQEIVVRVLDSGPGVPVEALPKIFEPFYRLDDARNRQTGGVGLGLSIADRAIRLHGGQLRASNRKEGGLEVEMRIPAAAGFALPAHS